MEKNTQSARSAQSAWSARSAVCSLQTAFWGDRRCLRFGVTAVIKFIQMLALKPGGVTPLYGLCRYVPRDRVWFLEVLAP